MTTSHIIDMTTEQLEARTTTVSPKEAAGRLGLQDSTLANWRWHGRGPRFLRVGRRVRYRLADLAEWMDTRARTSTSDPTPEDAPTGKTPSP